MNGYRGLGTKSLKICNAVPRPWNKLSGYIHFDFLFIKYISYIFSYITNK